MHPCVLFCNFASGGGGGGVKESSTAPAVHADGIGRKVHVVDRMVHISSVDEPAVSNVNAS